MALIAFPDIEAWLTAYLRAQPEIADLVGDRVYTEIPNSPTFPLVVCRRVGGAPLNTGRALHVGRALCQIDAYGGPKATARALADLCRQAVHASVGTQPNLVVSHVLHGGLRWMPDTGFEPSRPRYLYDAQISFHQ